MATLISVNGEDGATLVRSSGIRLVQEDPQALVARGQNPATRDGRPGRNAPQAISGGPAGTLAVQLSESNASQGAIHVERIRYAAAHQPPRSIEVPIGRNILFTAIGGEGEGGQNGEDGERGRDGADGTNATNASDATNGTDGGRGGDAGAGSHGGNGGPGGAIHLIVHESATHLLMAISWDVQGGRAGSAGVHGKPGAGGRGGKEGEGWRWNEIVGYKPFCTDSCIKSQKHAGQSKALTRAATHLNATTQALTAQVGALTVSGNNLQTLIAQTAARYKAMQRPNLDNGYCRCGGGNGTCTGCDVKPIEKTFQRQPGLVGKEGERGSAITTPLVDGIDGEEGTVTIAMHGNDGVTQEYHAAWSLELIDFDVEDENGDGIFEPGEHVFIRRIHVRNAGGMPSPTCRIPVTLANASEWFEPVTAEQGGVAYLPTSIPAGESASTSESLKVRIKARRDRRSRPLALENRFVARDTLRIRADMPWLERRMPFFDFFKEIEIGYPYTFGQIDHLSTISQGAISKLSYQILNLSHRSSSEANDRSIEVRTNIPVEFGRLTADMDEVDDIQSIGNIRPQDSLSTEQLFRLLSNAQSHKHFQIKFELWLDRPDQDRNQDTVELVLIERKSIRLQVSHTYIRSPNASFLLVTNPKTTEEDSHAIQHFIRSSLGLEVDLYNIHQHGGVTHLTDNQVNEPQPVTNLYRDKSIIFLDNVFEFFEAGESTSSKLCDPEWMLQSALKGNSIIFIGYGQADSIKNVLRYTAFPHPIKHDILKEKVQETRQFSSFAEFVDAIKEEKQMGGAPLALSSIPLTKPKWYRFGKIDGERQARTLERYLRNRLPNERFLVTHAGPDIVDQDGELSSDPYQYGYLIVQTGLNHHHTIVTTEKGVSPAVVDGTTTITHLDAFTKYHIVASIPICRRLDSLWRNVHNDKFVIQALVLSIERDIEHQVTGFLKSRSAHKSLSHIDETNLTSISTFFKVHLPCFVSLLYHSGRDSMTLPPESIIEIFDWALAFTGSMKRHRQLHSFVRAMIRHQYGTIHLADSQSENLDLCRRISQLTTTPKYVLEKGVMSSSTLEPQTRYCSPTEWNAMVSELCKRRERLKDDMVVAQKALGRMVLDDVSDPISLSESVAVELSS